MKLFRLLILSVAFPLLISCDRSSQTESDQSNADSSYSIIENEEMHRQIAYLKFDSLELLELSPQLQNLYASIVQNTNYASGISISNIMEEVNDNLNRVMDSDSGAVYEKDLINDMNLMKGNQRMASHYFNQAGRRLLRKFFEFQSVNYPALRGQVSELKVKLGDIDPRTRLIGQEKKVRQFIDQCFVILYLIEEEMKKEVM